VNYLDLFSGIGGFALGAYWAGMRFDNHYFSEIEPYAVELYQKRFPDAIALGDIKEINCEKLADADGSDAGRETNETTKGNRQDTASERRQSITSRSQGWIITGGFPCQDISVAGKGEGIGGSRSGLWFEYWRIIRDLRPRYAIMENVGALTFRGLDRVLGSLAEIGYDAEWQDIRAEDMGAPHRRERIWIVAYPNTTRLQGCAEARNDGENGAQPCDQFPTGCGRGWATEPDVGRLAHGVSSRVDRLRGLGNSIVPQIAQLIFEQIKEYV